MSKPIAYAVAKTAFAVLSFTIAALPPVLAAAAETVPTLSIMGVGEVSAQPDMAIVTSGVITQAKTAREALDANNEAMTALFAALKDAGIEPRDIQTSNFSVQPEFAYPSSDGITQTRELMGYTVSNNVAVRVMDLDGLGMMIDKFVSVGANQIYNISFGVEETADLYEDARKAAVADALAKAQLYADAAGVELRSILSISEGSAPSPMAMDDTAMMRMSAEAAVPVAAGELSFSSTVHIQWTLAQN